MRRFAGHGTENVEEVPHVGESARADERGEHEELDLEVGNGGDAVQRGEHDYGLDDVCKRSDVGGDRGDLGAHVLVQIALEEN